MAVLDTDDVIVTWWATRLECRSAIARKFRLGELREVDRRDADERLVGLAGQWSELEPNANLRELAEQLVARHPLRAADALQLAAAIHSRDAAPRFAGFVTLDARLAEAARKEGLDVLVPHA